MLLFVLLLTTRFHSFISSVECYDFKGENWFAVAEMNSRRCRAGVAVLDGLVYAVGGFNGSLRVRHGRLLRPYERSVASCSIDGSASQHVGRGSDERTAICHRRLWRHNGTQHLWSVRSKAQRVANDLLDEHPKKQRRCRRFKRPALRRRWVRRCVKTLPELGRML